MKLKFKIAKLEDVEEKYRDLYEAKDGAFFLSAEGAVEKARLDEFRETNIKLTNDMEDLAKKFEGLDIDEVRKLMKAQEELKTKKLIEAGKVDELLAERTAAMKAEYEKTVQKLTGDLTKTSSQLEKLLIDAAIQSEAVKHGVADTAMDDVLLRGRQLFKVQDGKAVPVDPTGKVIYGKDGVNPQGVGEWLAGLAPVAPHLFRPSQGGGARPASGSGNGAKQVTRVEFEAMPPEQKMAFAKDKGVVTD